MTREEEIEKTATCYVKLSDAELNIPLPLKGIIKCAFRSGARWADEHPKNVWHDASEMPDKQGNLLYILPQGSLHISNIPSALRTCKLDKVRWEEYAKELGVVKWAYINDLLPKTKEL